MTPVVRFALILSCWLNLAATSVAADVPPLLTSTLPVSPNSACLSPTDAKQHALRLAAGEAKNRCRQQGYGWRASMITNPGTLACQACSEKEVACAYRQISFACRPHQTHALTELTSWSR